MKRNASWRSSRRSASRLSTWAWVDRSSALTGSSSTSTFGSQTRARAMAMRWRWPPENCDGSRSTASPGRPTDSSASTARLRESEPLTPIRLNGSARVWPIVRDGLSDEYGSWNTTRSSDVSVLRSLSDALVMSLPCRCTDPALGGCRPSNALPIVDLPDPDSPTSPSVSPGAMSKVTSSTAGGMRAALRPLPYRTTRSRTLSAGRVSGSIVMVRCARSRSRRHGARVPTRPRCARVRRRARSGPSRRRGSAGVRTRRGSAPVRTGSALRIGTPEASFPAAGPCR